jgi:Flp pilus assembly CpaF family ATPase
VDHELRKRRLREAFFEDIEPIKALLDQDINDIMLVAPWGERTLGQIYVSRSGFKHRTGIEVSVDQALAMCERFAAEAGMPLNREHPQLSAFSPLGGFRIEAAVPPASLFPTFSLRLHRQSKRTLAHYVEDKTMTLAGAELTARTARGDRSILVAGVMGSGKTTMGNALLVEMADARRVLTIEDARELSAPNELCEQWFVHDRAEDIDGHAWAEAIARAMRSNADRIVVGEIRKPAAARTWTDAGMTGHPGCATIHAYDAEDALLRLWLLCRRADESIDRELVAKIVGHVLYMRDRRPSLYRVCGLKDGAFRLEEVRL